MRPLILLVLSLFTFLGTPAAIPIQSLDQRGSVIARSAGWHLAKCQDGFSFPGSNPIYDNINQFLNFLKSIPGSIRALEMCHKNLGTSFRLINVKTASLSLTPLRSTIQSLKLSLTLSIISQKKITTR
jgi:hypothetical protein